MSEAVKHTPGPWRVGDNKLYVEVWGRMEMNAHPIVATLECDPREANARLISAAPEMLKALTELYRTTNLRNLRGLKHVPSMREQQQAMSMAYAAIAKAEGRS